MAKDTFSAAEIFGDTGDQNKQEPQSVQDVVGAEEPVEEPTADAAEEPTADAAEEPVAEAVTGEENAAQKKSRIKKRVWNIVSIVTTVLVFALFASFLLNQYSMAHPTHDDYGYATLSYVYWEPDMYGQNFSMDQFVHYLVQHYNRWGGRILSFGQIILLMKPGEQVAQAALALLVFGIFALSFFYAQYAKRARILPMAALFCCALFGLFGKSMAISGLYWYCAAILYTVPVLYVLVAAGLVYLLLLDRSERTLSLPKLMILPFACVISFFAGWSMEQVGIFAVVTIAALVVYACFTRRNPLLLFYGLPPLIAATVGCHYLISAVGNESRKRMYADYYALSFGEQILTSAKTIVFSVFSTENLFTVILIVGCGTAATLALLKKGRTVWRIILASLHGALGAMAIALTFLNWHTDITAGLLWRYLIVFAVAVSVWLLSSRNKRDFLIWAIFFGGLASQGGCLISPIYPTRCLMPFALALICVAVRAFSEIGYVENGQDECGKRRYAWLKPAVGVLVAVVVIGGIGALRIYSGFSENEAVNQYNEKRLRLSSYEYNEKGLQVRQIALMRLKDDSYSGSTQPYGRDLIKDWMKIYYMLPDSLERDDFVYEEYDEDRLKELQDEMAYEVYSVQTYNRIP